MPHARLALATRCLAIGALLLPGARGHAQSTFYTDRAAFEAALSGAPSFVEDYETYAPGSIAPGDVLGRFAYDFDPGRVQPAVASDGLGGQALGGWPFDVFVGDDSVRLLHQPAEPGGALFAFGAEVFYAPVGLDLPADTYRLGIADGALAGQYVGSPLVPYDPILGPVGGSFFLGVIARLGTPFTAIDLYSAQLDPGLLVPAYQVDNLTAAQVPEPDAAALGEVGGIALLFLALRSRRRASHR